MDAETPITKEEYIQKLNDLYTNIENWLKEFSIICSRDKNISLSESYLGEYTAPVLTLSDKNTRKIIAEMRPAGAQIIGARGRVDIVGAIDKQFLIYLTKVPDGKLRITVTEEPFITGSNIAPNWYWTNGPLRSPHQLNPTLFLDLITAVSDYDARQHA